MPMRLKTIFPTASAFLSILRPANSAKCLLLISLLMAVLVSLGYFSNWLSIPNAIARTKELTFPTDCQLTNGNQVRWLEENAIIFQDYKFIQNDHQRKDGDVTLRDRLLGPVPHYKIIVPFHEKELVAYAFSRSRFCPFLIRTYYGFQYGHSDGQGAVTFIACFGLTIRVDARQTWTHFYVKRGT